MIEEELLEDLELYARHQLVIKPKEGPLIPLQFNRAQQYIHQRLEEQIERTGKVRAIILKGRQQGCSTYVAARFYHKTVANPSILTFIFAHDSEASSSLYGMVKTFYEESPDPDFRPIRGTSNAKELLFPNIRSGYKVGTAGTKGLGRSKTIQQIHWSEVAYSPNCDDHAAGMLQTVPNSANTEIILESTANGQGDYFHRACVKAMGEERQGDFELIFVPWYWQPEYSIEVDKSFELEQPIADQDFTSEQEYHDIFKDDGLTLGHIAWRRKKIHDDFQGDVMRFMREYPFTPEEAFEASGTDSFIKAMLVRRARNTKPIQSSEPLIMGVDPARLGGDKFKVCHRKGRSATKMETYPPMRLDQAATRLARDIDNYKPMIVNIDAGGLGVGLYDAMIGMGYGNIVNKVDFGGAPLDAENNKDMTAEMFRAAREWFEDQPCSIAMLDEKDQLALQSQLSARRHDWFRNKILVMESKKKFKEEFKFSPDDADAFLLTFAKHLAKGPQATRGKLTETYVATPDWNPF